jgi:hypothetical protein
MCWQFRGSLHKASSLIHYDKFKPENIAWFIEYRHWLDVLFDHTRYHFLDEKHIVNSDAAPNKVHADPQLGYIDNIPVSGDFRDAYNLMVVITGNPAKNHPIVYSIGQDNGDAVNGLYPSKDYISNIFLVKCVLRKLNSNIQWH